MSDPIDVRLERLEERLGRLERLMGVEPAGEAASTSAPEPPPGTRAPIAPLAPVTVPARPARAVRPPKPARKPRTRADIERFVATRIVPIGGAIVLMIAAALIVRLMVERGMLTDTAKCLLGGLLGVVLIVTGEVVRRKINAVASAGLSGPGIGAIYISVFGASSWYGLIGPSLSFVLLVLTAALGIAIAARGRLRSIAVLSSLGGYAAPFLLHVADPSPLVLPVYALVLLTVGLVLAWWRPAVFAVVRGFSWWGTVLVAMLWAFAQDGISNTTAMVAFLVAFWLIVHGGLSMAARRGLAIAHDAPDEPPAQGWRAIVPVITSFSTTGWVTLMGVAMSLKGTTSIDRWMVTGASLAAAIGLSSMLAGHLRTLRDAPRTDSERLGAGLAMQAGGLLIATVAFALDGSAQSVSWLAMGVAFVGAGRWANARPLDFYGLILLIIGSVRVLTWDAARFLGSPNPSDMAVGGLVLTGWMVLMVLTAASWLACARLELVRRMSRVLPVAFSAVGLAMLVMSLLHPDASALALGWWWLLLAVAAALVSGFEPRLCLSRLSVGVLGVSLLAWCVSQLPNWLDSEAPALLHPGLIQGLVFAGVLVAWRHQWPSWSRPEIDAERHRGFGWLIRAFARVMQSLAAVAVLIVFVSTSLEVARLAELFASDDTAGRAAVSIWWGLFAVGLIVAGFIRRLPIARHVGLAMLLIAAGKAALVDLAGVPEIWRVASFLGLGLLMSAVAVAYFRVSKTLDDREPEVEEVSG